MALGIYENAYLWKYFVFRLAWCRPDRPIDLEVGVVTTLYFGYTGWNAKTDKAATPEDPSTGS